MSRFFRHNIGHLCSKSRKGRAFFLIFKIVRWFYRFLDIVEFWHLILFEQENIRSAVRFATAELWNTRYVIIEHLIITECNPESYFPYFDLRISFYHYRRFGSRYEKNLPPWAVAHDVSSVNSCTSSIRRHWLQRERPSATVIYGL